MLVCFRNLSLIEFQVRQLALFLLFSVVDDFEVILVVVLDGKSLQEYPVHAGVPQGSILCPTHFLLYLDYLPDDIIYNVAIFSDDYTLCSILGPTLFLLY